MKELKQKDLICGVKYIIKWGGDNCVHKGTGVFISNFKQDLCVLSDKGHLCVVDLSVDKLLTQGGTLR